MAISDRPVVPLSQLEVLVIDCQATAAAPRGHLLEIAWAVLRTTVTHPRAHLIALSADESIPPAVTRITGLSQSMMREGVDPQFAWRDLAADAAMLMAQPAPTVIHFARFEQPFLRALAGGALPLDIVCTHDIARRLFPDLPRRSLRALAGYLGHGLGALRRSADHVEATAFLWQKLVHRLEGGGVATWGALRDWLATPADVRKRARRVWPMPREARLSVPKNPGVYRMLRTSGDVLYVGKAASLHDRVNSHFRKQRGVDERMLEMLSQARAISVEVTSTPLEAALLEADEIKRRRPPYNLALATDDRAIWFTSSDLSERRPHPSEICALGPLVSTDTLDRFGALARADRAAVTSGRWGPDEATFHAGYERLCATHRELSRLDDSLHARLLRLGTRLWREGRRDRDGDDDRAAAESDRSVAVWTPELVHVSLERLVLRAALARRRAIWLTRLVDASVVWREPGAARARLM
jgi:DNA polymerase-3 subunit epsilon